MSKLSELFAGGDEKLLKTRTRTATSAAPVTRGRLTAPRQKAIFDRNQGFADRAVTTGDDLSTALAGRARPVSRGASQRFGFGGFGGNTQSNVFNQLMGESLSRSGQQGSRAELAQQLLRGDLGKQFAGQGLDIARGEDAAQFEGDLATSLANAGFANQIGDFNTRSLTDADAAKFVQSGQRRRELFGNISGGSTAIGSLLGTYASRGRK